jgi:hypothetical protein
LECEEDDRGFKEGAGEDLQDDGQPQQYKKNGKQKRTT